MSERLALAATVNIVELDIACGEVPAALQLGRPLALSLRHSGHREMRFELLAMTFSALLIAGDLDEARATAGELYDLALRLDTGKLYSCSTPWRCSPATTGTTTPRHGLPLSPMSPMGRRAAVRPKHACKRASGRCWMNVWDRTGVSVRSTRGSDSMRPRRVRWHLGCGPDGGIMWGCGSALVRA